jgi:hypothetical protein
MYSGGGQTVTTQTVQQQYDPVASRKMAEIAERSQEMSEEQWELSKAIFEPYEREMVAINRALLPYVAETSALQMEEAQRDIRMGRDVKDALRESQLRELGLSEPATEKFYKEAVEGVDVGERMGMATADVAQAYKGGEATLRRSAARMGLKPTAEMIRDMALQESKAKAGARTGARTQADIESFQRLQTAMGARGRATGLPGTQVTQANVGSQVGGYGLQDPANLSAQLMGQAQQGYGLLAGRPISTTTMGTTVGSFKEPWGVTMMEAAGTAAGAGSSAAMGSAAACDKRLKKDIHVLATVKGIEIVSYRWADDYRPDDSIHIGVIAQQVKEVLPEFVGTFVYAGKEYYSVDYNGLMNHLQGV